MAYQNVGTPRFYIDFFEWMKSIGNYKETQINNAITNLEGNPFGLHPEIPCIVDYVSLTTSTMGYEGAQGNTNAGNITFKLNKAVGRSIVSKINYQAILGHNLSSTNKTNEDDISATEGTDIDNIHLRLHSSPDYVGFHSNRADLVNCEDSQEIWGAGEPTYTFEDIEFMDTVANMDELNAIDNPQIGDIYIVEENDTGAKNHSYCWTGEEWGNMGQAIQSTGNSGYFHALNDGFSIRKATGTGNVSNDSYRDVFAITFGMDGGTDWLNTESTFNLNSISLGTYYDMPHSPELDVTMTIENDGFDAITTQGGSHLTNIKYNGAPMWNIAGADVPPWTIGEPTAVGRRRGRRVWSMNFKYLSEKDLFASNYMSNTYTENLDGYVDGDKDIPNWGANVLTNGDFSDTTSTDSSSSALAGWTNIHTHDSNNKFTITSNKCRIISDGNSTAIYQEKLTIV